MHSDRKYLMKIKYCTTVRLYEYRYVNVKSKMLSTKNLKKCFFEAFTVYHSKLKLSMGNTADTV